MVSETYYYPCMRPAHENLLRAGTGLKLHADNLQSLNLQLGQHTTSPLVSLGVSVNYGPYTTVNVSSGSNAIPLGNNASMSESVVRIVTEGWQNNRIELQSLTTNHVRSMYVIFSVSFVFSYRIAGRTFPKLRTFAN